MLSTLQQAARSLLTSAKIKALLSICAALLVFLGAEHFQTLDHEKSSSYFKHTLQQAGVAYAGVRVLNASVSVIMESDLQIQPAGVGVSLALGQVLDPLNDLCERVADALVLAIVSLGLQQLLYSISLNYAPYITAALLLVIALLYITPYSQAQTIRYATMRMLFFIVLLRCLLPLSASMSSAVYQQFFQPAITQHHKALELAATDIKALADFSTSTSHHEDITDKNSLWQRWFAASSMQDTADLLARKSEQIKQAFVSKKQYALAIIGHLLELMSLYVALFAIQIILLPILVLMSAWRFIQLFSPHVKT